MLRFIRRSRKPSVITLADRARDAGQWDVAARYYEIALRRNPNKPAIWVQYGHVLKESGNLTKAEQAYRQAIGYDSRIADPHLHLGHILKVQGREDEVQTAYLAALALNPLQRQTELTGVMSAEQIPTERRSPPIKQLQDFFSEM